MLNSLNAPKNSAVLNSLPNDVHKNVQISKPNNILLLDILKTMELALHRRRFLPNPVDLSIHPLWFIAENERNIYLWRHGYSLNDLSDFEFWIDIEKLAKKRITQLMLLQDGFCQTNPSWGLALPTSSSLSAEVAYLEKFLEITAKIEKHIYALSKAGLLLLEELDSDKKATRVVTLPSSSIT